MGQPGFQWGDPEKGQADTGWDWQPNTQGAAEGTGRKPTDQGSCKRNSLLRTLYQTDQGHRVLQQCRRLRNIVEAPIRQSLLTEHSCAWPDTRFHTKARQFPVKYGIAAFSRSPLALATPHKTSVLTLCH